jgi:hypothetical protein
MKETFSYTLPFKRDGFKDLITRMIFLAQALGFDEKNWVTGKELELLVEMTRQYYLGISLESRESILGIIENTSFTDKDKSVYIYRSHLKNKGWIEQTPNGYDLIPFLKTLNPEAELTELKVGINSL